MDYTYAQQRYLNRQRFYAESQQNYYNAAQRNYQFNQNAANAMQQNYQNQQNFEINQQNNYIRMQQNQINQQVNYAKAEQNYVLNQQNFEINQQNNYIKAATAQQNYYNAAQQNYYNQVLNSADPLVRPAAEMIGDKIGQPGKDVMFYMLLGEQGNPTVAAKIAVNPNAQQILGAVQQVGNDVLAGNIDRSTAYGLIGEMRKLPIPEVNYVLTAAESGTSTVYSQNLQQAFATRNIAYTMRGQTQALQTAQTIQAGQSNGGNAGRGAAGYQIPPVLRAEAGMIGGKIGLSAEGVLGKYRGKDGNMDIDRLSNDYPQHAQFFRVADDIARYANGNVDGVTASYRALAAQQSTSYNGGVNVDRFSARSRELAGGAGLDPVIRQSLLNSLARAQSEGNGVQNVNRADTGKLTANTPSKGPVPSVDGIR